MPPCPEGSTWNGERCAGSVRLERESLGGGPSGSSADASGGRPLETLTHESVEPARPPQVPIPDDLGTGALAGHWTETFGTRTGCADKVHIRHQGSDLVLIGEDCHNGTRYVYEGSRFEGSMLIARAVVPDSGYVIDYWLFQTGAGRLEGKAVVSGGGSTNVYDVSWSRGGNETTATAPAGTARQGLQGVWVESFAERAGCSDKVAIQQVGNTLRFSGADCNSGDPYVYSEPSFNGIVLTVKVTVPSTRWVIQYTLRQTRPGELKGQARVTGAGRTNTYDVTWTRQD